MWVGCREKGAPTVGGKIEYESLMRAISALPRPAALRRLDYQSAHLGRIFLYIVSAAHNGNGIGKRKESYTAESTSNL